MHSRLRANDQIHRVRAGDSTQVKTADRALRCIFCSPLVVTSDALSRNNSKVTQHRQYERNECKCTGNYPDDCPSYDMELSSRLLHNLLRRQISLRSKTSKRQWTRSGSRTRQAQCDLGSYGPRCLSDSSHRAYGSDFNWTNDRNHADAAM